MRILHTMLRVVDLDRSLAFYTGVLEMKLLGRYDHEPGRLTLAFVGYTDLASGDAQPHRVETAWGHIALGTDDIRKTCEAIRAAGGRIAREPVPLEQLQVVIAFVEDPDGYSIELIQTTASRL